MSGSRSTDWDDPEKSVGERITKVGSDTLWEAKGPARDLFSSKFSGPITDLLRNNKEYLESGEDTSPTSGFHLWMVGTKPRRARPTVIFTCRSLSYRKKFAKLMKEANILSDSGIKLKTLEKMPAEPMSDGSTTVNGEDGDLGLGDGSIYIQGESNFFCGRSILVGRDQQATLGGVFLVKGTYYGFTALHSGVSRDGAIDSLIENQELAFDQDSDMTSTRTQSLRSKYSISTFSFHGRPSIDLELPTYDFLSDWENPHVFPDAQNESGDFRRIGSVDRDHITRTLDYDIFQIEDPSSHVPNKIPLPRVAGQMQQFLAVDNIITTISESQVLIATGKSGVVQGTIIDNPCFIKMAGLDNYQKMWPVRVDRDIVPGDCGSWVVDAHSGGLYGHVVAGDASLHRAYIISAIDVVNEITARFGRGPSLPQASKILSDQQDPCTRFAPHFINDSSGSRHADRESVNQPYVRPLKYTNGNKSSNYSSDVSNFFAKQWDPIFSTRRNFTEEKRHIISKSADANVNAKSSDIDALCDYLEPSCATDEIVEFCQSARLADIKSGYGIAGVARYAWLDDRSLSGARDYYDSCTTATGLYQRLMQPRFGLQDTPDADRRLIYIRNLSPNFVLSLVETASHLELSPLRDAIWNHIAFQSAIRITSSCGGFPVFHLEMHIPYFILRESPPDRQQSIPRHWTDLSFLNLPDQAVSKIREAHITFIVCGTDNGRWTGYSFVDSIEDEEDLADATMYDDSTLDPISNGEMDVNLPIWDPREYFLKVYQIRLAQTLSEWEYLVRTIERAVRKYQNNRTSTLSRNRSKDRHQIEDVKSTFDWTQQTLEVLSQLLEVLCKTITTWETFRHPGGDIEYFSDIDTSRGGRSTVLISFQRINKTFDCLKDLRERLRDLAGSCRSSAEALQLRLTLESSEAVRNNESFTQFIMSFISPFCLAIAYYSIPQNSAPFRLEAKYFFVAIIIFMAFTQLLFVMFSSNFLDKTLSFFQGVIKSGNPYSHSIDGIRSRGKTRPDPEKPTGNSHGVV